MDMEDEINRDFRIMLRPFMDLFEFKKSILTVEEWMAFVNRTKASVINNPVQFLGKELPNDFVLEEAIEAIFAEYLAEESALA